jgi:hypothetical protein
MSIIILKKDKLWFGYSCLNTESFTEGGNYFCDLQQVSVQIVPFKNAHCLVFYDSTTGDTEKMVARNFLPGEIRKLKKLDQKNIAHKLLPTLVEEFRKMACLHVSEDGKDVRLGGDFVIASKDGIVEIANNLDVEGHQSFFVNTDLLLASLFAEDSPLTVEKARKAVDTDSWNYYGGIKIYEPEIIGYLDDPALVLTDGQGKTHEIKEEELECH